MTPGARHELVLRNQSLRVAPRARRRRHGCRLRGARPRARRLVAFKAVRNAGPSAIARFKREFRALAGVIHPNLVALYELIAEERPGLLHDGAGAAASTSIGGFARVRSRRHGGSQSRRTTPPTRTLEPGTTTATPMSPAGSVRLRDRAASSYRAAARRAAQLAEGVCAIHDAGMLHRDIKPSNVLGHPRRACGDPRLRADRRHRRQEPATWSRTAARGHLRRTCPRAGRGRIVIAGVGLVQHRCHPVSGADREIAVHRWPRRRADGQAALRAAAAARAGRRRPRGSRRADRRAAAPFPGSSADRQPKSFVASAASSCRSRRPAHTGLVAGRLRHDHRSQRRARRIGRRLSTCARGRAVLVRVAGPRASVRVAPSARSSTHRRARSAVILRGPLLRAGVGSLQSARQPGRRAGRILAVCRSRCRGTDAARRRGACAPVSDAEARGVVHRSRRRAVGDPDPLELRRRAFVAFASCSLASPIDTRWCWRSTICSGATSTARRCSPRCCVRRTRRRAARDRASAPRAATPMRRLRRWTTHVLAAAIDVRDLELRALAGEERARLPCHLGDNRRREPRRAFGRGIPGNPFLIEELARLVRDESAPARPSRSPRSSAVVCCDCTRNGRLLAVIAVAGRPIVQAIAERAAGVEIRRLWPCSGRQLVRSRSVGEFASSRPTMIEFARPRSRFSPPKSVGAIHRRLALVSKRRQSGSGESRVPFAGAGDSGRAPSKRSSRERAAEHSRSIARRICAGWPSSSIPPRSNRTLRLALAEALANAGRAAEAADAFLAALEGASPAHALELQGRAASQLLYAGRNQSRSGRARRDGRCRRLAGRGDPGASHGVDCVDSDPSRAPPYALPPGRRARGARKPTRSSRRRLRGPRGPRNGGHDSCRRFPGALHVARAQDRRAATRRPRTRSGGRVCLAGGYQVSADGHATAVDARPARIGSWRSSQSRDGRRCGRDVGVQLWALVRLSRARGPCRGDLPRSVHRDALGARDRTAVSGLLARSAGRIRELAARFPVLVKEANDRGDLDAATSLRACLGFYVPLSRDEPEVAHREVDEAMNRWSVRGFHLQHANALNSRTIIDLYLGEGVRALDRCHAEWPALRRSMLLRCQLLRVLLWSDRGRAAVAAFVETGHRSHLREAAKCAARLAREDVSYARSERFALQAAVARGEGDLERALSLLDQAIAASADAQLVLNHVAQRHAKGMLVGGDEEHPSRARRSRSGARKGSFAPNG